MNNKLTYTVVPTLRTVIASMPPNFSCQQWNEVASSLKAQTAEIGFRCWVIPWADVHVIIGELTPPDRRRLEELSEQIKTLLALKCDAAPPNEPDLHPGAEDAANRTPDAPYRDIPNASTGETVRVYLKTGH